MNGLLDKILNDYVGGAGKYQLFNTIIMAWVYYAGLYALFVTNFAAYEPPHRCWVDQCDELEFANQSTVGNFSFFLNFQLTIQPFCFIFLNR